MDSEREWAQPMMQGGSLRSSPPSLLAAWRSVGQRAGHAVPPDGPRTSCRISECAASYNLPFADRNCWPACGGAPSAQRVPSRPLPRALYLQLASREAHRKEVTAGAPDWFRRDSGGYEILGEPGSEAPWPGPHARARGGSSL
jgi:hypothetical protein